MSTAYRVIRASAPDANRIAPLLDAYRVFYKKQPDLAASLHFLQERLSAHDSVVYMALAHDPATRTDIAIGFAQLYPTFTTVGLQRMWVLNDLFVDPDHRRRGVGQMLMQAAELHARQTHALGLSLLTAHDNLDAQHVYSREGWSRDEQFQRWVKRL